jgi:hypothetical protein
MKWSVSGSAIMGGASGYVLKQVRGNDLVSAITRVGRGEYLIDPALTKRVLDRLRSGPEQDERLARLSEQERRVPGAADGIPSSALPSIPVQARASSFRLRDFDLREHSAQRPAANAPPPAEHPLVVILGTEGDDRQAWLQAGQALGRVLLQGAAEGVSASPMTQVLEVPATRLMLARQLGLVGHPQMLLRMGYGRGHRQTPRRPISEVLTV